MAKKEVTGFVKLQIKGGQANGKKNSKWLRKITN